MVRRRFGRSGVVTKRSVRQATIREKIGLPPDRRIATAAQNLRKLAKTDPKTEAAVRWHVHR